MATDTRIIDDTLTIRMVIQRLCLTGAKVTLACRKNRGGFQVLLQEPERIFIRMRPQDLMAWELAAGENVELLLEDRGFKYESVVEFAGTDQREETTCGVFTAPRTLRRNDAHPLVSFRPDAPPQVTFSNLRNDLLDGQIDALGTEGFEMSLKDPARKIEDVLRMGEVSTLDLALEDHLRFTAAAQVEYFGDNCVGLRFTDRVDKSVLGQYRNWLDMQQKLQVERDRQSLEGGFGRAPARGVQVAALPQARLWVDRHPTILVLTEQEEFARHLAEALGRKFGFLSLDYITGKVRPFLRTHGGDAPDWGRVRLVLVHNHLRIVSPLELTRQIVSQEKCPLPVVLAGTSEDEDLKRNRALAAGAVDYLPVEPFRILSVLRRLDETLKLFEG